MSNDTLNQELDLNEQEAVTGGGITDLWNSAVRAVATHILNNKMENIEKANYLKEHKNEDGFFIPFNPLARSI